jgi:hypothetical protein
MVNILTYFSTIVSKQKKCDLVLLQLTPRRDCALAQREPSDGGRQEHNR